MRSWLWIGLLIWVGIQTARAETPAPHSLRDTQFILVDGIFGDVSRQSFAPVVEVASEWGARVEIIRPSTLRSVPENAEWLVEEIRALRARAPQDQSVVIAHSKGAAEVVLMMLRHPGLLDEFDTRAVISVQGAIQGTPLLGIFNETCDLSIPGIGRICGVPEWMAPPLAFLDPTHMHTLMNSALNALGSDYERARVTDRIFFARSQIALPRAGLLLAVPAALLAPLGPNDGLIPTEAEKLPDEMGHDLGVFEGNHNSLLETCPPGSSADLARKAFVRQIVARALGLV